MKPARLGMVMDPIAGITPAKDSSLAMLLEAQARGWELHYGQLQDIWLRDGQAFGPRSVAAEEARHEHHQQQRQVL